MPSLPSVINVWFIKKKLQICPKFKHVCRLRVHHFYYKAPDFYDLFLLCSKAAEPFSALTTTRKAIFIFSKYS